MRGIRQLTAISVLLAAVGSANAQAPSFTLSPVSPTLGGIGATSAKHREGGTFTDVTTSLDTTNNVICGQTSSLSPFVVAVSVPATPTPTPTPGNVDHFTCYKAGATSGSLKFPGIPIPPGVSLVDQFGPSAVEVKKPKFLCAPTNKMGEDPTAPTHSEHLKGYQIKNPLKPNPVFPTNITVTDQFNPAGMRVDAKKQSHLLVPTVKDRVTPPPLPGAFTVDHFQCYKVATSKGAAKFVPVLNAEIEDQFGIMHVDVKKPKFLCNPVDKNGEDPTAPTHVDHLMCYQVKQVKTEPAFQKVVGVFVNNQFGPEQLDVKKSSELCVPALKNPPQPTPTPTPTSLPGLGCGQQPAPLCAADCGPLSNCIPLDLLIPGADGCVCEPPTPTPPQPTPTP